MKVGGTSSIMGIVGLNCQALKLPNLLQTVRPYISVLLQARKLVLGMNVNLIITYKVYEYCHS